MKKLVIFVEIIFVILTFTACDFAPGSYPYAEKYNINVSEVDLIKAVEDFKKHNPQYIVPNQLQLNDGRDSERDHWYHIYFYYPVDNQIVYAWTRPIDKEKTTFAFVSINQGLMLGNWKEINKDFNDSDNNDNKVKFEKLILNEIKKELKNAQ